ncbi:nitrite reductase large subunit NirB [Ectobacillus ponti]|uniref:Nitrite reductase large subunit NirB n=1 Tax=Ectobacillus ponti TaxID=2961894 RepID=A0AA41X412_9BACI|nr:nitrite reductase large subunit NirB [Ectobacillus ponti]MCP8968541.1 nitrite reductase large subunit NirB [Ectobacillus ponti]
MSKQRLVMIGNGMAGVRCMEEILKRDGERFDITIFGDEPYPNYNRIQLSNILQGKTKQDEIMMNDWSWYEENGITLYTNERVTEINREQKTVVSEAGRVVAYDVLLMATGSSAFILPVPGHQLPGVTGFRTIDDCNMMIQTAGDYKKAVVIGGGLLGLEAARGLLNLGMEVEVVHLMPHLMEVQLDAPAGELLKKDLEAQGMKFLMEKKTAEILGHERVTGLRFDDGTETSCDLVVMAVGIRPNTQLAKAAGLAVNRGIVVNDYMETSDPSIFAVGECNEHNGLTYGLVAPLYEQAVVLADHICDKGTAGYHGSVLSTQLKVSGCDLFSAGQIYEDDDTKAIAAKDDVAGTYKKVLVRDNKIAGIVLYGDVSDSNRLFRIMKQGADISEYTKASILHKGNEEEELSVASMPAEEVICGCNGVTKGAIVQAVLENDLKTFEQVKSCTKAGGSCGKCKPLVVQVLEHTLGGAVQEEKLGICECTKLDRDELVEAIKNMGLKTAKEVRNVLGWKHEEGCAKCRPALNFYLGMIWPQEHEDEKQSRLVNERMHANIQKDGTYSVIPRMYGGVTDVQQLRKLADVAEKYNVPLIKLTGGQRLGLFGVKKEDLPAVWEELGMPSGYAYGKTLRTVKTCVGAAFCRFGTQDSMSLGIALEKMFEGVDTPHKVKMGVSACPRSCVESGVKDFGVIGVENGFQIYIGGNGGTEVKEAKHLCTLATQEEVLRLAGAFVQYYRETGKYLERTAPWMERLGFEHIKEVMMDEARVAELYARYEQVAAKYREPWAEVLEKPELHALYEVKHV